MLEQMEDASEIAKKKHLARQKRYYERNAEAIRERKRETYDAAKSSEYYAEHRDEIRERQRNNYMQQKKAANIERLNGLLAICPPEIHMVIEKMIEGVQEEVVRESDVIGIEKAVLLCVMSRNNVASDSKSDE